MRVIVRYEWWILMLKKKNPGEKLCYIEIIIFFSCDTRNTIAMFFWGKKIFFNSLFRHLLKRANIIMMFYVIWTWLLWDIWYRVLKLPPRWWVAMVLRPDALASFLFLYFYFVQVGLHFPKVSFSTGRDLKYFFNFFFIFTLLKLFL